MAPTSSSWASLIRQTGLWLASDGPSRLKLGSLVFAACVATSGCTSIHSKLSAVPKLASLSKQKAKPPQQLQAFNDPKERSLQIALETARLAEARAMDAEAIIAYEEVRQLDPERPGVAHALAVLYDRAAMTDAAQREYATALQESPENVGVLCDYGYFLYSTGRLQEAEQTLRRAAELDTNHQQTNINLAVVLATLRQYDEATSLFEKAIGPAAALHNIGMFKLRQGDTIEGKRLIASAMQKDPSLGHSRAVLENVADTTDSSYLAAETKGLQR